VRSVYLLGPPGVGKTSLMDALLADHQRLPPARAMGTMWVEPLIHHDLFAGYHLGKTRPGFGGTDALSYSVLPDAVRWVSEPFEARMWGEGARLAHPKFAAALIAGGHEMVWVLLDAPAGVLTERCSRRGSTQNESWRAGAGTRARNAAAGLASVGATVRSLDATMSTAEMAALVREWMT